MLSVKKMTELYVNYDLSDETWHMLRNMALHGILPWEWSGQISDKRKDWSMDADGLMFIAGIGNAFYRRDVQGVMGKV